MPSAIRRRLLKRRCAQARASGDRQSEGEALADLALYHVDVLVEFRRRRNWVKRRWALPRKSVTSGWWRGVLVTGCRPSAREIAGGDQKLEQALRTVRREASRMSSLMPLWLGSATYWRGECQRAITLCQQGERAAADRYDGTIELWTQAFRCLAHIGLGEYAEALTAINDGLTKARTVTTCSFWGGSPTPWAGCTRNWAISSALLRTTATALILASVSGNSNVEISALINLGFDYLHLGEPEKASPAGKHAQPSREGFDRTGGAGSCTCACIADTLLVLGAPDRR